MNKPTSKQNTLNLIPPVIDYIENQLLDILGIKCIILDENTAGIISLVYSQSSILKRDVFLIEKIERTSIQKMLHLKVVYLVRPTQQNYDFIMNELKDPRFSEYYFFFTNTVSTLFIEKIAEIDEKESVKGIQEVFMDHYCIQEDLFTLNIPSTLPLTKYSQNWNKNDTILMDRICDGLSSVMFSLRKIPMIRYQGQSEMCSILAQKLTKRIREEYDYSPSQFVQSNTLLLIIDRREDPITPLLNQWTYQAMLHELIGVNNNRVDIKKGQAALTGSQAPGSDASKESEFVVSSLNDQFFKDNMCVNFGDLASNIKDFIDRFTAQKQQTVQINSLEDMQRAVDRIPELKQLSGNLSKHVSLSCEISRLVDERQLLKVSKLEQDMVCRESNSQHFKELMEILNDRMVQNYEKLKLVMIYALRYENDDKIGKLKDVLRDQQLKQNSLNLINYLIDYAGKAKRSGDLFFNKTLLTKATNIFKKAMKDVPNIYTQHQPYILHILEQIQQGKLKDSEFPATNLNSVSRPQEIIIFFMGGATFEESKEIQLMNKQPNQPNILLGGTYIHNSRTFLAEVSQLGQEIKNDTEIDISNAPQRR